MLKGISRFFGTTFLSLGFTLLILSIFVLGLFGELDNFKAGLPNVVRDSLREYGYDNLLNENQQLRQVDELCELNSGLQDCEQLNAIKKDPGSLVEREEYKAQLEQFNLQLDDAINIAIGYEDEVRLARIIAVVLLIIGGILIYLGSVDIFSAGKSIGFSLGFSGLLSYFVYSYGIAYGGDAAKALIEEKTANISGLMNVMAENGYEYVMGFVQASLDKVAMLSLIIGIFGVLLLVGCWIMKMQKFKKEETRK